MNERKDKMRKSFLGSFPAVCLGLALTIWIVGCGGSGPSGKYVVDGGGGSVEFKSGQAILTTNGQSETCSYTQDGSTYTVKSKEGDFPFTLMQDGTLQGMGQTFKKAAD